MFERKEKMLSFYKKFVSLIAIVFAFYSYSSKANEIVSIDKSNYFKKSLLSYPKECKGRNCYETTHFVFKKPFVVKKFSSKEKFKIVMKLGLYTQYDERINDIVKIKTN